MFVGTNVFSRPSTSLTGVRTLSPLRPNSATISQADPVAPEEASVIWYRLEDLRRQSRNAKSTLGTANTRLVALERDHDAVANSLPGPAQEKRLGELRKAMAECRLQIKTALDTIREGDREIDRQIACLKQLHVNYDAKTGRVTSDEGDSEADSSLILILNSLHDQATENRRQYKKKEAVIRQEAVLTDLMALLGGTVDDPNGTNAEPDAAEQDHRVRAFIKTNYCVSGPAGSGSKVFEAYAPVMADAADVGLDGCVATTFEPGIHGGWNAHESIASQQQPPLSVIR